MIAPFAIDGAIKRASFEARVERVPVSELRPAAVVVMDTPFRTGPAMSWRSG